ncbi:DNRLRE domain-containing protein [Pseudofrankia saprophytica]|uniref:DNRLRE domain-containing protein n=1 Tax=Pseudofrankia saprophytica TaxID=298655 RepID=UPI0002EABAB0|nr:DNRLRE domain-containing protein [Pseudofrankia saprophytica]
MALLLVPVLVMTGVALVVLDRVTHPNLVPISEQNPFLDSDVKLPESTSGSAADREHLVPANEADAGARGGPVSGRSQVTELPGTVPTTGTQPKPLHAQPFVPKPPTAAEVAAVGSAPREARFGDTTLVVPERPAADPATGARAGRVEVPSLRTADAEVFRNRDGTYTTEVALGGASRFKNAKGDWVGVDTALVVGDKGRLRARSTQTSTEVAARADDAALGRLDLGDGTSVAFGVEGARPVEAKVDGSTATYAGIAQDADLELVPTAGGLKEVLVLGSAAAPTSWVYPLALTGLTAKVDGRQVVLVDRAEKVRAVIPAGYMTDGRPSSDGMAATSDGVAYSLTTTADGRPALRMDLDTGWLAAKDRVFPVRVDPTLTQVTADVEDTYVSSANPTTNYSSSDVIRAGVASGDVLHGYLRFPNDPALANATVVDAKVRLVNTASASGCIAHPVSLREVKAPWWGTSMTWPGAVIGDEVATKSFAHDAGWLICKNGEELIGSGDQRLRKLANTWTHDPDQNFGLAIVTSDSTGSWLKEFASTDCACNPAVPSSDLRPRLDIDWTPYGATYGYPSGTPTWLSQPTTSGPGQVVVRVTNSGQFTWPANGNFKLSYHIYNSSDTTEVVHQGLQTTIPTDVDPGEQIDLTASVSLTGLSAGTYHIRWDMEESGTSWFSGQGVPMASTELPLASPTNQTPYVAAVSPESGTAVASLRPPLTLSGVDPDSGPSPMSYQFQLCTGTDANSGTCWTSGWQASNSWSPPRDALAWGHVYYWRGQVKDGTHTSPWTQPLAFEPVNYNGDAGDFGWNPYVPSVAQVHPMTQNYTASVTDAVIKGAGPSMEVTRTYNSSDPADGIFGVGWTSSFDTAVTPVPKGAGDMQVRYGDGQRNVFGRGGDGTYDSPRGQYAFLQASKPRIASFTVPNSTSVLGATDTGESWEILAGTWGVQDGEAYLTTAGGFSRSVAVMPAPSDGTVQFSAPVAQDYLGVSFRVQDVDNMWMLYVQPSTNALVLAKRSFGFPSVVATYTGACCDPGDTYGVRMSGNTIAVYRNDRVVGTVTDSYVATATRAGLFGVATGAGRVDSLVITPDQHRDSFTNPNSTSGLGSTDDGEGWVDSGGTWGTDTNRARAVSASGRTMSTIGAAPDGTFTFMMPVAQNGLGLAFRAVDEDNYWRLKASPSTNQWLLVKTVEGVDSVVSDATGQCCTAADTMKIVTAGTSIRVYRNGTEIMTADDPALLYGGRAGPFAESAGGVGRIDDVTVSAATTLTQKGGLSSAFRSDGRLVSTTDPVGNRVEYAYNTSAQLTSATNQTTHRSLEFTWTGDGRHVETVETPSVAAHSGPLSWTYTYDGNNLETVTGPQSPDPTEYDYNDDGRLTEITLPEGNITAKIGYNPNGTVAWSENGEGDRTRFQELQSDPTTLVRTISPNGDSTVWEYSAWGQLVTRTDYAGSQRYTYNDDGYLTETVDENNHTVEQDYDDHGNVLAKRTPRADDWTVSEYWDYFEGPPGDPRTDQVIAYRNGNSAAPDDDTYLTTYEYDSHGQLVTTTAPSTDDFPSGRTTTATYTTGAEAAVGGETMPAGMLATSTDAAGKTTTYAYDSKGDLRGDTDPVGLTHEYTYDELGRRLTSTEISDTYPGGLTTTYTYSELGAVATTTEPGVTNPITSVTHTRVTTNSFDTNGNITETVLSDATGGDEARTTTFDYDDANRRVATTVAAGTDVEATSTVTYDGNGNVASSTDPNGAVTEFTYTPRDQLATTTLKDFVDDPVAGSSPRDVLLESRAYDPAGRLAAVTDTLGRTTELVYFHDGLLHQKILKGYHNPDFTIGELSDTDTRDITLEVHYYDGTGHETDTGTANWQRWTKTYYNPDGLPNRVAQDEGGVNRWTSYGYDANGNLAATTTGTGENEATAAEIGYDDANRVAWSTVHGDGPDAFTTNYSRDQRGVLTGVTDPRGHDPLGSPDPAFTTSYLADPAGRVSETTYPEVAVEENGGAASDENPTSAVGYNTFGEVTDTRDARGEVTTTAYDELGHATETTHPSYTPPGGSPIVPTESWTYDAKGNVLTHTDLRGQTTTTTYDRRNRPVAVTDPQVTGAPDAGVTRMVYDDTGNLLDTVDQNGAWTIYAYDDLDRRWASSTTERSPLAAFTTYYDHDDAGEVTRVLRPSNFGSGASVVSAYNNVGDLVETTDEAGKTTSYGYDDAGRLMETTDPLGRQARSTYDRAGRLTGTADYSDTDTELRTTGFGYDEAGNLTSQTDPNGHTSTFTFDALNQPRTITVPASSGVSITTSAGYDAAGNRTRLTDGNGHPTVYTFNALGLPEKTIEPSTPAYPNLADRTWQATYDSGGLPVTLAEPGGVTRSATYDELGRLTLETGSGSGVTGAARSMGYDLAGNLTSVGSAAGDEEFSYNDRGLLQDSWGDLGGSSFTYDEDGRLSQRADGSTWSNYDYDARGLLSAVDGGATSGTRVYDYDDAGQLTSVDYHGGTGAIRTFDYDQLGRITSDTLTGPSGTLRTQSYGYDDNDNLTSTTISGPGVAGAGTQSYGYDWANRLTSWTNQASATTAYGWDGAGNRISAGGTSATYDARNRLVSNGSTTYAYTARGTLTTKTAGANVTTTVFDAFDRLVSHTVGTTTTSYTYDGLDRIATRTHGGAYNFLYNGVEKEPSTDGTSAFARGPDGALIGAGTGSGDWVTLENAHGDVAAAFTTDGASVTESRSYDPFGTPQGPVSTDLQVGFQGNWTDPDTHLVAAQARWYDPTTATFLSRDTFPLPWTGTAADNRYTYAAANPLTNSDPTGLVSDPKVAAQQMAVMSAKIDNKQKEQAAAQKQAVQQSRADAELWAGIAAAVAYKNAYMAKYPGLPPKAYDEMIALGQDGDQKWIAGVNAYNAMNAAKLAVLDTVRLTEQWDREQSAAAAVRANTATVLDTVKLTEQWDQQQRATAASNTTTPAQLDQYAKTLGTAPAASGNRQVCGTYAGSNQCLREYDLPTWLFDLGWGTCDFGKYGHCDDQDPNHFSKYYKAWSDKDCHGALQCGAVIAASVLVPIPGAGGVGVGQDLAAAGKLLIRGGEGGAAAARAGEGAAARVGDDLVHACSFAGATPVLMADGTTKPIDQIQVGDKVLATDPETGEQKPETVTHIWIHHDQLTDLDLADGTVLTTTEDHPYWSADDQRFEPASELAPGENVLQANDRVVAVTGLQPITAHDGLAYNLSVHEIHTYHVGNDEILVHNACGDLTHAADCYCNWGEPVIPRPNVAGPADEFTGHALQRLEERGVSAEDASAVLGKEPFSYRHEGQWKLGYYDPNSKVFVAKTIDGNINTVMTDVEQAYVNRLQGER